MEIQRADKSDRIFSVPGPSQVDQLVELIDFVPCGPLVSAISYMRCAGSWGGAPQSPGFDATYYHRLLYSSEAERGVSGLVFPTR